MGRSLEVQEELNPSSLGWFWSVFITETKSKPEQWLEEKQTKCGGTNFDDQYGLEVKKTFHHGDTYHTQLIWDQCSISDDTLCWCTDFWENGVRETRPTHMSTLPKLTNLV